MLSEYDGDEQLELGFCDFELLFERALCELAESQCFFAWQVWHERDEQLLERAAGARGGLIEQHAPHSRPKRLDVGMVQSPLGG